MDRFEHRGIAIERHGRKWPFRLMDGGRVLRSSHATPEEARAALDTYLDRRAHSDPAARRNQARSLPVAELCSSWLGRQAHLAPATHKSYEIHLRVHITPKIGALDANLIRPVELEDFYRTLNYATAQKCHMVLRGALSWGIRNERLARPSNPTFVIRPTRRLCADHDGYYGEDDDFRPVPEKAIPSAEEIKLLIKDAHARGQRWWWLYLVIAVATGARPGEICALRRRDFDLEQGTIRIEWTADKVSKRLKRPKTPWSIRTLRLTPAFFAHVAPHLPSDPDAFLFPSDDARGSLLPCRNSRSIERKLDRQLQRLGLPHYTPHGFRHYAATHLLDKGWVPMQVGKFLGHRDDQMVRKLYGAHIVDDTQRGVGEEASRMALDLDDVHMDEPPSRDPDAMNARRGTRLR